MKSGMKTGAGGLGTGEPRVSPLADSEAWLDSSLLDLKSSLRSRSLKQRLALRMPNTRAIIWAGGSILAWALVFGVCWAAFIIVHRLFG